VDLFMKNGGSLITLAKGNRSKQVTEGQWFLLPSAVVQSNTMQQCLTFVSWHQSQLVRNMVAFIWARSEVQLLALLKIASGR